MKFARLTPRIARIGSASLLCLAAISYGFAANGETGKQPFLDAVRDVSKATSGINVNLDNLVAKYIPVGTSAADVVRFCQSNGLRPWPSAEADVAKAAGLKLSCFAKVTVTTEGKFEQWTPEEFLKRSGYKFYLYFKLSEGKVVSARGYIALISL